MSGEHGVRRSEAIEPHSERIWAPFEKGNEVGLRHGSYSVLKLAPRAAEIADGVRALLPVYSPADEPAVQTLAVVLARLERATEALDGAGDPADLQRLRDDLRGWANTARRYFNDLGMTPTSRAKLGLDLVRARGEAARAHIEAKYGADGEPLDA